MLVDRIYQPTLKDIVSGIRQTRYFASLTATPAAANIITVDFPAVPPDTARFLTNLTWVGTPGAAQFTEMYQGFVTLNGIGTGPTAMQSPPTRNAAVVTGVSLTVDLLLLPGEVFRMLALFNAGVANNALVGFLFGYDIPRANLV